MRKVTRFELETVRYAEGDDEMPAEASYEGGRFTFVLSNGAEFSVSRDELVSLVEETEDGERKPEPYSRVYLETVEMVERFLRRHKGRVVQLTVQRKNGTYETRNFECYRFLYERGALAVFAYQLDHEHYERIPLCSIRSGQATDEQFTPRYEVEL